MRLIVSEKKDAAKRVAEILAVGKPTAEKVYTTDVFNFRRDGEDWVSIGLRGHIMEVDFPEEYAKWRLDDLADLVNAAVVKLPQETGIITSLKNIATISVPEPRMLTIQPFDPTALQQIERAIMESDLGLTPSSDGKAIRPPQPPRTDAPPTGSVKPPQNLAAAGPRAHTSPAVLSPLPTSPNLPRRQGAPWTSLASDRPAPVLSPRGGTPPPPTKPAAAALSRKCPPGAARRSSTFSSSPAPAPASG